MSSPHRPFSYLLFFVALGCASTPDGAKNVSSPEGPKPTPLGVAKSPEMVPANVVAAGRDSAVASPTLFTGARVMTAAGDIYDPGHVLVVKGRIAAVGPDVYGGPRAPDLVVVDVAKKVITPGIIDTHSHMGVYPAPDSVAHNDGNELTRSTTPDVWAEHAVWPQDPSLSRALASGVTLLQVLPGSANLIGGRSVVIRPLPGRGVRHLAFPGARQGLKMACGENPKRFYGSKGQSPSTRMGNLAGWRQSFSRAVEYQRRWEKYRRDMAHWETRSHDARDDAARRGVGDPPEPPTRDQGLDTLSAVLNGDILVHIHCYRADEMLEAMALAEAFGFRIRSFHHAVEAYKIAPELARAQISVSTWADWWGFKLEAYDGVPHNAAIVHATGGRAILHSDSPDEVRHLNHEAVKARTAGRQLGMTIDDDQVLRWITANPAWALGLEDEVGALVPGLRADLVVWDQDPLSVYARPEKVYVDGNVVFDRANAGEPASDFELGQRLGRGANP